MSTSIAEVPNGALLSFIERAARDPEFDVQKFSLLLDKQAEMVREQARREYYAAMADVQQAIRPVFRSKKNAYLGNHYATLDDVMEMLSPIIGKYGIALNFGEIDGAPEGEKRMEITVSKGGWSERKFKDMVKTVKGAKGGATQMTDQQMSGATDTYAKRYLVVNFFNITTTDVDDDGEAMRQSAGESMRAAAAPMPRAARIAEQAPAYDAPRGDDAVRQQPERKSWSQWADSLEITVREAQSNEELGKMLSKAEVAEIHRLAQEGPRTAAKDRIIAAVRSAEERYLADPPIPDEEDAIEINGAEKVAAG